MPSFPVHASLLALAIAAPTHASLISYMSDGRRVHAEVISELLADDPFFNETFNSTRNEAPDLDHVIRTTSLAVDWSETHTPFFFAEGEASWSLEGTLDSELNGDGFTAIANTSTAATTDGWFRRIEMISQFDVVFEVNEPIFYDLSGMLTDSSSFSFIGQTMSIAFGADEGLVELSGQLAPGRYRFSARAGAQVDGRFTSESRTAGFGFTLDARPVPSAAGWPFLAAVLTSRRRRRSSRP